jgi:pre-mRNA-splicing factor ATP-dependent RNA helicase DHX16
VHPRATAAAVPEIKRCNLTAAVLQLKALGIHNPLELDFIDPPEQRRVV